MTTLKRKKITAVAMAAAAVVTMVMAANAKGFSFNEYFEEVETTPAVTEVTVPEADLDYDPVAPADAAVEDDGADWGAKWEETEAPATETTPAPTETTLPETTVPETEPETESVTTTVPTETSVETTVTTVPTTVTEETTHTEWTTPITTTGTGPTGTTVSTTASSVTTTVTEDTTVTSGTTVPESSESLTESSEETSIEIKTYPKVSESEPPEEMPPIVREPPRTGNTKALIGFGVAVILVIISAAVLRNEAARKFLARIIDCSSED